MTSQRHYTGKSSARSQTISATPIRLLAATLDLPVAPVATDDSVSPLWHWLYFLPDEQLSELGEDGHPRRGNFYPEDLPRRRMFGGANLTFHQPLRIGETATCRTEIVSVDERQGASGPLVLLRLLRQIEGEAGPSITELQTLVYSDAPPSHQEPDDSEPPEAEWQDEVSPDARMLFRFSALTFNTHRIHYDDPYTREVEGYPALVVHGPLTALLLAELARRNGLAVEQFEFRARSPIFVGEALRLRGTPTSQGADLAAYRGAEMIMEATARGSRLTRES